MRQAVQCLAIFGRAVLVGISDLPFEVDSYREVLGKETEIIGSSDHLVSELPLLFEFAARGALDLSNVITRAIPLDAARVNATLDALGAFGGGVRTVILP